MRPVLWLLVILGGCQHPDRGSLATQLETTATPLAKQCVRVDGSRIGALPLELEVGGAIVRFAEWTQGDARSADVFGFAAHVPEGVTFTVEAGDRTFTSSQPRWLHPAGVSGPRAHRVDAVTFCSAAAHRPALALID